MFGYYIKDISGRLLAQYVRDNTVELPETTLSLIPVYGASRIGLRYVTDGEIDHFEYELTDYLGNVRATVKKTNETAELTSYADFYPGGMKMPGRNQLGANPYPFAYQGQFAELDDETGLMPLTFASGITASAAGLPQIP